MDQLINKTMDRADLLTPEAKPTVDALNGLILALDAKGLHPTSWYGTLPRRDGKRSAREALKRVIKGLLGKKGDDSIAADPMIGRGNRGADYEPLPGAADDDRIPWYLYWEIYWVMANGPRLTSGIRVLDAGGTSSLFTCYLASLGCEVHSVDLNRELVSNGDAIAKGMGWRMLSYTMNMKKLKFEDAYFDHAYSICVFEHLDHEIKHAALAEIARCLKPNGVLSITFDYRNPAPYTVGHGLDTRERNQLKTEEHIKRVFLSSPHFAPVGNQSFYDNGKSYLVLPQFDNAPYTFGAIFLRRKERGSPDVRG
jgi:ubiquinone/menaquinone biosynthesis C-methylase UbiE